MSEAAGPRAVTGPAPPPLPLRRNSGFRLLWTGQVLSGTGTEAALIAYPLLILALTHSPVIAGVVATVREIVQLALGLPGGALSDRLDRRMTMIICDIVRAAVLALLAGLVLAHLASWPVVLAVAAIDGAAGVPFDPSASATLPAIVADQQLEHKRGRVSSTTYQASMSLATLAPLISGLLVEHVSGQWAMAAFATVMGVAAAMHMALPGLRSAQSSTRETSQSS